MTRKKPGLRELLSNDLMYVISSLPRYKAPALRALHRLACGSSHEDVLAQYKEEKGNCTALVSYGAEIMRRGL